MTAPAADDQAVLIIPSGGCSAEDLVRVWVAAALDGMRLVSRLRAVLVVEELVSNAYRHGRLPCVLRLSLDDSHRFLQVFVDDSGADDGAVWIAGSGCRLWTLSPLTGRWSGESGERLCGARSEWVRASRLSTPHHNRRPKSGPVERERRERRSMNHEV